MGKWREIFCWHNYVKSRFQFQALNAGPNERTVSLKCDKCGKFKYITEGE